MKQILATTSVLVVSAGLMAALQTNPTEVSAERLKLLHTGMSIYLADYDEVYPMMSSPATQVP
ncbi:MAG TPA: hypothetical protein DIS87_03035, partial [Armatimonadetes bacterium]|nr:hypothetical protein [Armatimonadota bacterium]